MRVEIIPATQDHGRYVALHLRAADREEVAAASGMDPRLAIEIAIERSAAAWVGLVDGVPACVFGVGGPSLMGDIGVPWLLGTDEIVRHQRAFLRRNKPYVAKMLKLFPNLINMVDARNGVAINWLRWLGFTIHDAAPYGLAGLPFHPFSMEAARV